MRARWILTVLVCAALCVTPAARPAAAAEAPVTLALRSTAGTVLTYKFEAQFAGDFNISIPQQPPMVLKPKFNLTAALQQRTVSVGSDGVMEIAYQVKGFQFGAELSNLHFGLGVSPDEAGLIKLPEVPVHATINRQGKLTGFVGLEELLSMLPLLAAAKGMMPSGEAMQKMIDMAYHPMFPDKAVKPGDKWGWEQTFSLADFMPQMPGGMPEEMPPISIPMKETATFAGWEQFNNVRCARVDSTTEWAWAMKPPAGQAGDDFAMSQKGTVKVTRYLDTATGRLAGLKQEVRFTQDMQMGGQPFGKMDFTVTSATTLTGVSAGG